MHNYDAAVNIHEIKGYFFVTGIKATKIFQPLYDSIETYYKAFAAKLDPSTLDTLWYIKIWGIASEFCNASVVSIDNN